MKQPFVKLYLEFLHALNLSLKCCDVLIRYFANSCVVSAGENVFYENELPYYFFFNCAWLLPSTFQP